MAQNKDWTQNFNNNPLNFNLQPPNVLNNQFYQPNPNIPNSYQQPQQLSNPNYNLNPQNFTNPAVLNQFVPQSQPKINWSEDNDHHFFKIELPQFSAQDIEVSILGEKLSVIASKNKPQSHVGAKLYEPEQTQPSSPESNLEKSQTLEEESLKAPAPTPVTPATPQGQFNLLNQQQPQGQPQTQPQAFVPNQPLPFQYGFRVPSHRVYLHDIQASFSKGTLELKFNKIPSSQQVQPRKIEILTNKL